MFILFHLKTFNTFVFIHISFDLGYFVNQTLVLCPVNDILEFFL